MSGASMAAVGTLGGAPGLVLPGQPYLYLPNGWNTEWLAAKYASKTTPAWIMFFGDSTISGQNSSDVVNNSPPGRIKTALTNQGFGVYGDYWPALSLSPIASAMPNAPWSGWQNGVVTSTPPVNWGWHRFDATASTAAVNFQTFTSPYACTQMDLFNLNNTNATTWKYQVDGGAAVTVTNTWDGNNAHINMVRNAITGLSNATHTLAYGNPSAANITDIFGVATYPNGSGGTGIGYVRMGTQGMNSSDLAPAVGLPVGRPRLFSGISPQSDSGTVPASFGFPMAPHLAILQWGVNDETNSGTAAVQGVALSQMVQSLRAGRPNCSILISVGCTPDAIISDNQAPAGVSNQANWYSYMEIMYQIAQQYNCAILNLTTKWGETPVGSGFMTAGNIHPIDAGYVDQANAILAII